MKPFEYISGNVIITEDNVFQHVQDLRFKHGINREISVIVMLFAISKCKEDKSDFSKVYWFTIKHFGFDPDTFCKELKNNIKEKLIFDAKKLLGENGYKLLEQVAIDNYKVNKNQTPKLLKKVLRILASPFVLMIYLIIFTWISIKSTILFLRYGGEFIAYTKGDEKTIHSIYDKLRTAENG